MPHLPLRRPALRRAVPASLALALLAAAGPATATAAPSSRPLVSRLGTAPATLRPGGSAVVTGRVRNPGRRSARVLLAFQLQTGAGRSTVLALGGARTAAVAPGGSRSFRVRVRLGALPASVRTARRFRLVVCARSARGAKPVCRRAARLTRVVPAAATPAVPGTTPKPPVATTPTPPATPPAATTPTTPSTPTTPTTPTDTTPTTPTETTPTTPTDTTPTTPTDPPRVYAPGARTLGDTLFPNIGNGGYDVQHYGLALTYDVATKVLGGAATIEAVATQDLSEYSYDLSTWNEVEAVTVDGAAASFSVDAVTGKLIVTPPHGIDLGSRFVTTVDYSGTQQPIVDPDGSNEGWVPDTTYGAIVASEPVGAMGWFPNNDVPFDKATYTTSLTVPTGFSVVGTGILKSRTVEGGATPTGTTFVWDETAPTASYLYAMAVGRYDLSSPDPAAPVLTAPAAGGLNTPVPFYTAIDSSFTTRSQLVTDLGRTSGILDYYAGYYGVKYPFSAAGGVAPRADVGYSLETQGKPTYATNSSAAATLDVPTIAHENGHMYFGDDVTLTRWKDIWLNEGMTEFTSWLWQANVNGGTSLANRYLTNYTLSVSPTYWNIPPADPPTAADIFDTDAMYNRGATTMLVVHDVLGDARFRTMMGRWITDHAYGNATTEQFIALVKETDPTRAARWTEFFRQWLYTSYTTVPLLPGGKPAINTENFDTYTLPAG